MVFKLKPHFFPFLLLLLVLPSTLFLFQNSVYFNMHDDLQMIRLLQMDKCFADGQIPCRWSPDMGYGYGYPLFNFYPPLPYFVGYLFRLLDFSYVNSVKLTFAFQFFVLATGAYLLALKLFKNKLSALIVALFLNYAPYHALNTYVRGALNESWALAFFPWIIYFGLNLTRTWSLLPLAGFSISVSGILLSHLPMSLVFLPFSLIFILIVSKINGQSFPASFGRLAVAAVLGFLLSAFFVIPAVLETNLVRIEGMFSDYYHYSVHFTSLRQLFISNYWGDGPSVWGQADQMSFSVGYLHWLLPLLSLLIFSYRFLRTKDIRPTDWILLLTSSFGLVYLFLTHERSAFIWNLLPPLQKIQFPWRLLNPASFFLSLAAGWLLIEVNNQKLKHILSGALIFFVISLNLTKFYPITSGPLTDAQKFSGQAWTTQITSGFNDYFPKSAQTVPTRPPQALIEDIPPGALLSSKRATNWGIANLQLPNFEIVSLATLYFPNLEIYVNQNKYENYKLDPLGRPLLALKAGNHQIYYHYQDTPIRTVANFLSLSAILGLIIISIHNIKLHVLRLSGNKV